MDHRITIFLALLTMSSSRTIEQCLKLSLVISPRETSLTLSESGFVLHQLEKSVSWCEAYHVCRQKAGGMASIKTRHEQEALRRDMSAAKTKRSIWLGARIKDFGKNWTSITEQLADYERSMPDTGYRSAVLQKIGNAFQTSVADRSNQRYCINNGRITEHNGTNVTWFEAQKRCHSDGGRLPTFDEIVSKVKITQATSWIGIFRNPWIWVDGTTTPQYAPVLYSEWKDDLDQNGDCMIVNATENGVWQSVPCSSRYRLVLCRPKTDWRHRRGIKLAAGLFSAVLIIVIILVICTMKRKLHGQSRPALNDEVHDATFVSNFKCCYTPNADTYKTTPNNNSANKVTTKSTESQASEKCMNKQFMKSDLVKSKHGDGTHHDFQENNGDDTIYAIENIFYDSICHLNVYDNI